MIPQWRTLWLNQHCCGLWQRIWLVRHRLIYLLFFTNSHAIAMMAAERLPYRGFRHFAYCGFASMPVNIGLDVHQATISVAVLDSTGRLVIESMLETKALTIVRRGE
jgi:hypothetical protein